MTSPRVTLALLWTAALGGLYAGAKHVQDTTFLQGRFGAVEVHERLSWPAAPAGTAVPRIDAYGNPVVHAIGYGVPETARRLGSPIG